MSEQANKTRRNRISKRQRITCFLEALPDFKKSAEKYKRIKVEVVEINGKL